MFNNNVIAVPTFRRPGQLCELLDTLAASESSSSFNIVIGDNDCDESLKSILCKYKSIFLRFDIIAVPQRGVSQVRNAMVNYIMAEYPEWNYIFMLDDDGKVTNNWYSNILNTANKYSAVLVGGPVVGELPDNASIFAKNSIFATRRRWSTGIVSTLNTTQNLLVSRSIVDLIGLPLFQNKYGASGGEDYDLFRRVAAAGGTICWCDEAVVIEPAPAERLTFHSLLARYSTTGSYMFLIDAASDGVVLTGLRACKGFVGSILRAVLAIICFNVNAFARAVLSAAHFYGRLLGMVGRKTSRYVSSSGK